MSAGDQARQRRARAGGLVDQRLRHAAADRKSTAESRGEVGAADGEEFLVGVEPVAVLAREHAADRRGLDGGEEEARHRERQQRVDVRPADQRAATGSGRPRGTSPSSVTPSSSRCNSRVATMPPTTTNSATGRCFRTPLAEQQQRQRADAQRERRPDWSRPGCAGNGPIALPEVAVAAAEAEQLRQLRAGQEAARRRT